ncbi:MAG: hypothetical protein ABIP74_01790 [Candidatus Saccharimonas sp.]
MSSSRERRQDGGRESLWRRSRRKLALGTAALFMTSGCVGDTVQHPGYEAPSAQVINYGGVCPDDSTMTLYNIPGIGNNKIGVYAAHQEQVMFGDTHNLCYVGFSQGSENNVDANVEVLKHTIDTQHQERIMIVAQSYGLIVAVKTLNAFFQKYPASRVDFTLTIISSPGEIGDLWPSRQASVNALSMVPLTQDIVQLMTYITIVGQGDKNPIGADVLHDTNVAADNTPATLLVQQVFDLYRGVDELDRPIPMLGIDDMQDMVVNTVRAVQTIERRTGQPFTDVIYMTHGDHRMENHASLWWSANNNDYEGPLEHVLNESEKIFAENKRLADLGHTALPGTMRPQPR